MTPLPELAAHDVTAARAFSMARRLATGAGRASICAYELDPTQGIPVVGHGLGPAGVLLVAVLVDEELPATDQPAGLPMDVRVDLCKETVDSRTRMVAASMHLLGSLAWLDDDLIASMAERGELPTDLEQILELSDARLGAIRTERALLHDSMGVSPFCWSHMGELDDLPQHSWVDELDAERWVASLAQGELLAVHEGVIADRIAGKVCGADHRRVDWAEGGERVLCVDVDPTGLTLMVAGPEGTVTTFAAFDRPWLALTELPERVAMLRARAQL